MLVELYGLPGSGKSTLARELVKVDSRFVVVDFSSKAERYLYLFLYIINHPINFCQWMMFLFKNNKLFIYKAHLLSLSLAKLQKIKNKKDKIFLIDEGLIQRVLTVADGIVDNKILFKLLKPLNKLDRLVIMEGGDWHRFVNDYQKDNSPRVKLGQEYFQSWQKLQQANDKVIQSYLYSKDKLKKYKYNKDSTKLEDILVDLVKNDSLSVIR